MEISEWSINAYLIFVIFSGLLSFSTGVYLTLGGDPASSRKMWSGAWEIIIALCSIGLFRNGIVQNTWVLFVAVAVLVAIPYLLRMLRELLEEARGSSLRSCRNEEIESDNWARIHLSGKRRYVGFVMFAYGYGGLWLAIPLKIILLDWFPIYLFVAVIAGVTVLGYLEGTSIWKRNEKRYGSS